MTHRCTGCKDKCFPQDLKDGKCLPCREYDRRQAQGPQGSLFAQQVDAYVRAGKKHPGRAMVLKTLGG
jgi:hypothetical protein